MVKVKVTLAWDFTSLYLASRSPTPWTLACYVSNLTLIYVHFIFTFQVLVPLPSLPPITDSSHIHRNFNSTMMLVLDIMTFNILDHNVIFLAKIFNNIHYDQLFNHYVLFLAQSFPNLSYFIKILDCCVYWSLSLLIFFINSAIILICIDCQLYYCVAILYVCVTKWFESNSCKVVWP